MLIHFLRFPKNLVALIFRQVIKQYSFTSLFYFSIIYKFDTRYKHSVIMRKLQYKRKLIAGIYELAVMLTDRATNGQTNDNCKTINFDK